LEVHYNVKGKKKLMGLTTIKRTLVNSIKANAITRIRRTEPKVKEREKARLFNAISVVVQTTLQINGAKRSYEAHFDDVSKEATTSGTKVEDTKIPRMTGKEDMDLENTIVEYIVNDVFGDLN
jgi:hypothetical protein